MHTPWSYAQVLADADALLGLGAALTIPARLAAICDMAGLVRREALPTGCLLAVEVTVLATHKQAVAVHRV